MEPTYATASPAGARLTIKMPRLRLFEKDGDGQVLNKPAHQRQTFPHDAIVAAFSEALSLARQFEGATAPNPPVGCVLLDTNGTAIATGAHEKAGMAHAEAAAIANARAAGRLADIHTVIVTLEPCNHTGRTPPCADAILQTPAEHIWIGAMDPNPRVAGGGAARLQAAGLAIHRISEIDAELAGDAARLIAPFAKLAATGLPFVTVKQAIDETGSMVPPSGQKTFTSDTSLEFAHRLRKRAGTILTGSGTILADKPEFTVRRVPDFPQMHRKLVILDRRGRVPADYLEAARERGFETLIAQDLEAALRKLGTAGVMEVLVEAGLELTRSVLDSGLWDEHVVIRKSVAGPDDIEICGREGAC